MTDDEIKTIEARQEAIENKIGWMRASVIDMRHQLREQHKSHAAAQEMDSAEEWIDGTNRLGERLRSAIASIAQAEKVAGMDDIGRLLAEVKRQRRAILDMASRVESGEIEYGDMLNEVAKLRAALSAA